MTKEVLTKANKLIEEIIKIEELRDSLNNGLAGQMHFDSLKIHLYRIGSGIEIDSQIKDKELSGRIIVHMINELNARIIELKKEFGQ